MDKIFNYADGIMMNRPIGSNNENTEDYFEQFGGRLDVRRGLGGFPPIYLCEKTDSADPLFEEDKKTTREYSKHKGSVSISQIMKERRKTKPFISLN